MIYQLDMPDRDHSASVNSTMSTYEDMAHDLKYVRGEHIEISFQGGYWPGVILEVDDNKRYITVSFVYKSENHTKKIMYSKASQKIRSYKTLKHGNKRLDSNDLAYRLQQFRSR